MAHDELTMRIAIAWRDLRRIKPPKLSTPTPQGQLDTMDVMSQLGSCSMVELSNALRIDASTATRAVDRLVEIGMAERRRSDKDARTVMVELSKDGRALERRLTAERVQHMENILSRLTTAERRELATSLVNLLAASDAENALRNESGSTADSAT